MMIEGTVLPEDRSIENKVVILALLQKAQERGHAALTRIQVHKLLFVSEQEMWRQKILSSGFRFIKMKQGPWSKDIENTMAQLEDLGLVETRQVSTLRGDEARLASLTEMGSELVKSILELPSTGPEDAVLQAIEDALVQYGDLPSAELAKNPTASGTGLRQRASTTLRSGNTFSNPDLKARRLQSSRPTSL